MKKFNKNVVILQILRDLKLNRIIQLMKIIINLKISRCRQAVDRPPPKPKKINMILMI